MNTVYQVKEKLKNRPAVEFPSNCEWFNTSQPWTSDHLKGRLTLLDFWTYCCVNCMHILPDLEAIEEEFDNNEKVLIIGVHRFFKNLNYLVYYRAHDMFSRIFRIRIYKLFTNAVITIEKEHKFLTLRCQINEWTRLAVAMFSS